MTRLPRLATVLLAAALMAGCSSLVGPRTPITIFAPSTPIQSDPAWPAVTWALTIGHPEAARVFDNHLLMVSPTPGQLESYRGARWAQSPSRMLTESIARTLEDSGKIAVVVRQGSGATTDYRLLLDLRDFRSDYGGGASPSATIEVNAKLLRTRDMAIVGSRSFRRAQPATGVEAAQVSDAFGQALGGIAHDIAGWALATGQADAEQRH